MSSIKNNKKVNKKTKEKPEYTLSIPNYKFYETVIEMSDFEKLMKGDPAAWTKGELIGNYNEIKEKLGRVPTHTEMRKFGSRIPWAVYKFHYGNWENFMKEMGER